jgi:hypothetical protein
MKRNSNFPGIPFHIRLARIISSDYPAGLTCYASRILQRLLDRRFVHGNIIAAWFPAALSAFEIVRGIHGPALGAGIVCANSVKPGFIPHGLDPFQIIKQFYPVRSFSLELFEIITGIIFAFAAEINSPLSGA